MLSDFRHVLRDLFSPGGVKRHPVLCVAVVLVVGLLVFGLALRPL